MEILKIILFFSLIISAMAKGILHIKLINSKQNISHFKKPLHIGFLGQPFIPILSEENVKKKNTINFFVTVFYASLILLIILVSI